MADRRIPAVYTIPAHRAFADALAKGLIAQHKGKDGMELARGIILLPNNRAVRAVRDAFVRASGAGLLLPRLVPVGDIDLDETLGNALAPMGEDAAVLPAIASGERLMILTRLVMAERAKLGEPVDLGEGYRLATALAQTLDQLIVERKGPHDLAEAQEEGLSEHWDKAYQLFSLLFAQWPKELAARGCIDAAERRNRLLDHVAAKWTAQPPGRFVVAAGIVTTAPAVAGLLKAVAGLSQGMVVLPDLDQNLSDIQWEAIGPVAERRDGDPEPQEAHAQYALKQLLHRMGVNRNEVAVWRWGSEHDARAARGKAISNAMLPALLTGEWPHIEPGQRSLAGVSAIEATDPAEEAQAIAIALREAVETPEKTAALVTPDRELATRVSAHLRRWGIEADDSAGRPLAQLPPGTLLLALAQAGTEQFAPVALLALLKHPLVRAGEDRLSWLEQVRRLDLLLRGPRPPAGLAGIGQLLASDDKRGTGLREALRDWWPGVAEMLAPLEGAFARDAPLTGMIGALREVASTLTGERVWAGHQGHAAASLFAELETAAQQGPVLADPSGFVAMLGQMLGAQAVRPPQGGHPRIQILGLLEARLQQADLMILAGLNEGVWPNLPQPDPWLAPKVRRLLGLPGLERRIGLSAHDFANGLGAPRVILSRARRDKSAPTVASRFWLRLKAMTGERWVADERLIRLARAIDEVQAAPPYKQPAPRPRAGLRPKKIAVTDIDRLRADPYAFYAAKILALPSLEPVDADPGAAWRGTAAHDVLQRWMEEGSGSAERLKEMAREMLAGAHAHPLMRTLWQPRLEKALEWIAGQVAQDELEGRKILFGEQWGKIERGGIILRGKPDRVDGLADGSVGIVDYKSGRTATAKQVKAGFSLQLGLLGLIAREGGFAECGVKAGTGVTAFEYWKLSKKKGEFGFKESPVEAQGKRGKIVTEEFLPEVEKFFDEVVARWLAGDEPFTARPHTDAPVFTDYDQLMRLDEWFARGKAGERSYG
ncbi:MAG: double-strand break repair protein AddB [Sphingobium sp.]|nr:double-strand break repair protein AddB [Sphingobium sp.]